MNRALVGAAVLALAVAFAQVCIAAYITPSPIVSVLLVLGVSGSSGEGAGTARDADRPFGSFDRSRLCHGQKYGEFLALLRRTLRPAPP